MNGMTFDGRLERLERNVDEMMKMIIEIHQQIGNIKYKTGYIAGIVAFITSFITTVTILLSKLIK